MYGDTTMRIMQEIRAIVALIGCIITILGITSMPWVSAYGEHYTSFHLSEYSVTVAAYSYGILSFSIFGAMASVLAIFAFSSFFRTPIMASGGLAVLGWFAAYFHLGSTHQLWVSSSTFVEGTIAFRSVGFYLPLLGGLLTIVAALTFGLGKKHHEDEYVFVEAPLEKPEWKLSDIPDA